MGARRRQRVAKRKKFSYYGYPPSFNAEFKRAIRQRDGYVCAICGQRQRLDIHHIDYVKANTTRLNCIALCRTCHFGIHCASFVSRIQWKHRLAKLAAEREGRHASRRA